MVEEKLLDYVRTAFQKGFSIEDITKLLLKYRYSQRDIDEALWVVNRETKAKEESIEEKIEEKKTIEETKAGNKKEKKKEKEIEIPPLPDFEQIPEMPEHIEPKRFEPIPEIETKIDENIVQKFFPEKEKKKHWFWTIVEIIAGILLFAVVGVLMYMYLWPAVLNVR